MGCNLYIGEFFSEYTDIRTGEKLVDSNLLFCPPWFWDNEMEKAWKAEK